MKKCKHYVCEEVGLQGAYDEKGEKYFYMLGLCLNPECRTSISVESYVHLGNMNDGKKVLFKPCLIDKLRVDRHIK